MGIFIPINVAIETAAETILRREQKDMRKEQEDKKQGQLKDHVLLCYILPAVPNSLPQFSL